MLSEEEKRIFNRKPKPPLDAYNIFIQERKLSPEIASNLFHKLSKDEMLFYDKKSLIVSISLFITFFYLSPRSRLTIKIKFQFKTSRI